MNGTGNIFHKFGKKELLPYRVNFEYIADFDRNHNLKTKKSDTKANMSA